MNRSTTFRFAFLAPLVACAVGCPFIGCKSNEERPPIQTEANPPIGSTGGGTLDAGEASTGAPGTSSIVVAGVAHPLAMALDANWIYLAIDGSPADDGGITPRTGLILRAPRAGGGAPQVLADSQDLPSSLAVAATGLLWANFGTAQATGGAVYLASGGTPVSLVAGESVPSIITDDTYAYWTSSLGLSGVLVERALLTGAAADTLGTVQGSVTASAITSDGVYLYFVGGGDGAGIFRLAIQGGNVETLITLPNAALTDILVYKGILYVANAALAPNGSILTIPIAGGNTTTLVSGQDVPTRLAHDATNLYWTNDDVAGAVLSVPLAGGTPTVLASNLDHPRAIVADDALYVTTADSVLRIAK